MRQFSMPDNQVYRALMKTNHLSADRALQMAGIYSMFRRNILPIYRRIIPRIRLEGVI